MVTFDVSNLLTSKLVKHLHPENISNIFVTCDVSKFLKSKSVNLSQEENISLISATCDVSSKFKFSISVNFEKSQNKALLS